MEQNSNLSIAIAYLCLGVLFISQQGGVMATAMIITTVVLFAIALVDLINKKFVEGLIKLCLAILAALFTWVPALVSVSYYLLAALFIIVGIYLIFNIKKTGVKGKSEANLLLAFTLPLLSIVSGILLLFNAYWAFIVIGIILVFAGLINLYFATSMSSKK
ncbi:MAG: hypothetical protein IKQ31_00730 [Clostridia bacterium]|nr:hypothetical protein [Clostridia bacterium]